MAGRFIDFSSFTIPAWGYLFAAVWFAALALFIAVMAVNGDRRPDPAEDNAQLAYLKAWTEAKNAKARKDTRGQHEAMDRVQQALHARLRAGL